MTAMQQLGAIQRVCPDCPPGFVWPEGANYCTHHGKQIRVVLVEEQSCDCCRAPVDSRWMFCAECGAPQGVIA